MGVGIDKVVIVKSEFKVENLKCKVIDFLNFTFYIFNFQLFCIWATLQS